MIERRRDDKSSRFGRKAEMIQQRRALPDDLHKIGLDNSGILRYQRQIHEPRCSDDCPVKRVAVESELMRHDDGVQTQGCEINSPARDEGCRPMFEGFAKLNPFVIQQQGNFPQDGRRDYEQRPIRECIVENP